MRLVVPAHIRARYPDYDYLDAELVRILRMKVEPWLEVDS